MLDTQLSSLMTKKESQPLECPKYLIPEITALLGGSVVGETSHLASQSGSASSTAALASAKREGASGIAPEVGKGQSEDDDVVLVLAPVPGEKAAEAGVAASSMFEAPSLHRARKFK